MQGQVANAMEHAKEAAQNVSAKVSDFFQGNPFETPVGMKIGRSRGRLIAIFGHLPFAICVFLVPRKDRYL